MQWWNISIEVFLARITKAYIVITVLASDHLQQKSHFLGGSDPPKVLVRLHPGRDFILILKYTLGIQSYCQIMIGMLNHLLSKVLRFQYYSQEVIGSLGIVELIAV